jgi:dynein heavy chain
MNLMDDILCTKMFRILEHLTFHIFPLFALSLHYSFQNNNHLEDTNVVGLSHNAPMLFALPEADRFIGYLTAVLIPGATLNSGGKSVAAAWDSIHELLEQLPNNFVLDSIREDVQQLGSLHEPLGYVLLQEVVQMNVIIDIMRRDLSDLKSSLNGHCNISDKMEELLEVLMNKQVPASWLAEAHDSRHGLSKWYIHLLRRVKFLDSWNECLKEGKPSPPSVWLPGLLNPYALVTSVKQMHIRAETQVYTHLEYDLDETTPWEKLHLLGTITQWHSESDLAHVDPADLPQEGLLVHGLVLEGAAWESATSCLIDQVLQDVHPSVPRVHIKTVTRDNLPPALRFPMLHSNDDDPPYAYECPVYARASRGNSFIFSVHVKSQERATTWLYRAAALIMEV